MALEMSLDINTLIDQCRDSGNVLCHNATGERIHVKAFNPDIQLIPTTDIWLEPGGCGWTTVPLHDWVLLKIENGFLSFGPEARGPKGSVLQYTGGSWVPMSCDEYAEAMAGAEPVRLTLKSAKDAAREEVGIDGEDADADAEKCAQLFRAYDEDESGTISCSELQTLFEDINPDFDFSSFQRIFRSADADGDGELSYEEFLQWLMN